MPSKTVTAAKLILSDITLFSRAVLQMPLRPYQQIPLQPIIVSIVQRQGLEFLIVMPRQTGKNEMLAHLIVYLLNLFQRKGGNIVFGAIGDGLGRMITRVEERLANKWNGTAWYKKSKPTRRMLGNAAAVFISSSVQAHARGETAQILLLIDELQDQDPAHLEAVFEPMRAAENATAVYIGTVRLKSDALWLKKEELERMEQEDGIQRVFLVYPDDITPSNPHYGRFLAAKIRRYGRKHPIIASEYFLEPIDAASGLFPARRIALMRGRHPQIHQPEKGKAYVMLIDVGGQDEAATDPVARLQNPGRDYTTATIIEIDTSKRRPRYRAVDIFVDQGSRHFQEYPGRPSLADRLAAYARHWQVAHIVCDATGVGEGLADFLASEFPNRVTQFKFTAVSKAQLGSDFISIIETGRFQYWQDEVDYSDSWWFFTQAEACTYSLAPEQPFERGLRWSVKNSHTTPTPTGPQPTHDDRLLSAALLAKIDEMYRDSVLNIGAALSAVIDATDPLDDMEF
ncbi:MAG: hypothetical protein OCU12_07815 [Methanophagales archaeon]|nr:hypothetical protein [Methanophagales archaeon]